MQKAILTVLIVGAILASAVAMQGLGVADADRFHLGAIQAKDSLLDHIPNPVALAPIFLGLVTLLRHSRK